MSSQQAENRPSKQKPLYTPKQVSEILSIPGSTLRRLCADYGHHLSETARVSGKKRFFDDADLITLRKLSQLVKSRRPPEEIEQLIQVVDDTPPQETALSLLPGILAEFESLRSQLARLETDRAADREQMDALRAEVEQLRARLEQDRRPLIERLRDRLRRQQPPEPPT